MTDEKEYKIPQVSEALFVELRGLRNSVRKLGFQRQLELSESIFKKHPENWMVMLFEGDFQFHTGKIAECIKTYSLVAKMVQDLPFSDADRKYVGAYLSYRKIAIEFVQKKHDFKHWTLLRKEISAIPANPRIRAIFEVIVPT